MWAALGLAGGFSAVLFQSWGRSEVPSPLHPSPLCVPVSQGVPYKEGQS